MVIASLIATWIIVAVLTEALTEIIKSALPNSVQGKVTYTVSIAIGIALAYAFSLNVFGLAGIAAHVAIVSAGILASRGANYLNGFLSKIGVVK